ncbi:hypothetical protein F4677DRAFT_420368 [Hypoxylon crocopeplum]|nr:hypothetical protein F4677DRAFT_420368 [Hypoxylon crocopeplum]
MAPKEIPGYYWDAERRRHYKIEHSRTAPSDAAWSLANVKKRKLEDAEAEERLRQLDLSKRRIKRSRVLAEPLMGGFLRREHGELTRDLGSVGFARGLAAKGGASFTLANTSVNDLMGFSNPVHTLVAGECRAYRTFGDRGICSAPIVRDVKSGRVVGHDYSGVDFLLIRPHTVRGASQSPTRIDISDIKYSEKANMILTADRNPGNSILSTFSHRSEISILRSRLSFLDWRDTGANSLNAVGNTVCPAPSSSNDICVVGTNKGLAALSSDDRMRWVTPVNDTFRDIFAVDMHPEQPVVFFGGRPGTLFKADMRCRFDSWDKVQLRNSIAHLRQINEYQVLAAGVNNMLSVFDLRYCPHYPALDSTLKATSIEKATPVLTIPGYKNAAHLDIGLDYNRDTGVLATAHDDGKVALYSVRSGRRLLSQAVNSVRSEAGPIPHIQFYSFPGDNMPSLILGEKGTIEVYSFDTSDPDEEA